MELADVPAILILIGVAAYIVFAGADFGAGLWYLLAGPGPRGRPIRDFSYHAMAPVWEANHVWLIFVLVVTWTAYPTAFGSIMSTLAVPLFIAAVGIILRGTAYALRSGAAPDRETEGATGFVFGASSILTPFALGTAIGGIAAGEVPVGNAEGDLWTSWLNPTSITIGVLAVVTSGYLAAVYLAGDAERNAEPELARGLPYPCARNGPRRGSARRRGPDRAARPTRASCSTISRAAPDSPRCSCPARPGSARSSWFEPAATSPPGCRPRSPWRRSSRAGASRRDPICFRASRSRRARPATTRSWRCSSRSPPVS